MVNSIDPVPRASWILPLDPSYLPPSTSTSNSDKEGSGFDESTNTSASSTTRAPYFAWYAGRKSVSKKNSTSTPDAVSVGANGDRKSENQKRKQGRKRPLDDEENRDDDDDRDEDEILSEPPPAAAVVRWYRLYNRCSGGYLQLYMNDVNARGKYASPLAQLRVETDSYGSRIRIQSQKFGKYLCFNRRQRITGKYNGRSERCVFVEKISDNHYTELESAWRPGLYLGFNRGDGKFLDPSRYYTDRRTCFQFMKNSNTSYADAFAAGQSANQQNQNQQNQQNIGPTDFGRLSPQSQRWFRSRMRQESENLRQAPATPETDVNKKLKHRLRHHRTRRHRHHHRDDDQQK